MAEIVTFFSEPYINGNSLYIYAYSKSMSGPKM